MLEKLEVICFNFPTSTMFAYNPSVTGVLKARQSSEFARSRIMFVDVLIRFRVFAACLSLLIDSEMEVYKTRRRAIVITNEIGFKM